MAQTVTRLLQLIVLCTVLTKNLVKTDVFAALVEIEELYETESVLIEILYNYIKKYDAQLMTLKTKVARYKAEHGAASSDNPSYKSGAINSCLLTTRFMVELREIEDLITFDVGGEFLENATNYRNILKFPTDTDLEGAALGMLRLQDTYYLETSRIARGELNGSQYNIEMSAIDCFVIGRQAYLISDYYHTRMWMHEAMIRLAEPFALKANISEYLVVIESFEKKLFSITNKSLSRLAFDIYTDLLYESLCRKDIQRPEREKAKLSCRYVTNKSPFSKIAPLKLEEANLDPYIVIYHEVVYDNEIEVIKSLSKPTFKRSMVYDSKSKGPKVSNQRNSKHSFMGNMEHRYFHNIAKRIEDMTALTTETAEDMLILNYGLGGQYYLHYDFSSFNKRIATVLFYLSDVPLGGATVFPLLRIALWPKKGTAVFWLNLHKSGKGNTLMVHGACPVLLGSKWVATKWLHLKGQEWKRPCGLNPDHPLD